LKLLEDKADTLKHVGVFTIYKIFLIYHVYIYIYIYISCAFVDLDEIHVIFSTFAIGLAFFKQCCGRWIYFHHQFNASNVHGPDHRSVTVLPEDADVVSKLDVVEANHIPLVPMNRNCGTTIPFP